MGYLFLSFIAGILTILAPCVLPLLPTILGGTISQVKDRFRPIVIVVSLTVSIIVFTLLLSASTALLFIDPRIWNVVSGLIIFLFGIFTLFPRLWASIEVKLHLSLTSGNLLQKSGDKEGYLGAVLIGAALGPVFTSCSPTYALIVAVVIPQDFFTGLIYLLAYALGILLVFGAIAIGGQRFLSRVKWIANPRGAFKKILGILFIILGILIAFGLEKKIEAALLNVGFGNSLIQTEINLQQKLQLENQQ